jgi:hypothetical protein
MASNTDLLKKGLVDMKRKPEEPKPEATISLDESEKYPYGLRIDLNDDSLKVLGLSAKDFEAGGECTIVAQCSVTSVSSRENQSSNGKAEPKGE